MILGEKIRRRRRELDLTQLELARMTGCHPVTIHKWERGSVSIELKNIVALEKALQLPAASLLAAYCEDLNEIETKNTKEEENDGN